jgi:hypothetical protein
MQPFPPQRVAAWDGESGEIVMCLDKGSNVDKKQVLQECCGRKK